MSTINRFPPEQLDALKRGRAIPFLIEHRDAACPGHTLTVIGTIDDGKFWALLLADDDPDCKLVDLTLALPMFAEPFPIQSDASDAQAIHRLWSDWEAGVRAMYLQLFESVGRLLSLQALIRALDAIPPESEAPPPRKRAKAKQGTKPRKKGKRS
ncbi:hypothetical protein [Polycyclovorans algicola]|uniref:hypothetical protein n=1 Tax=Polycyclovorans algicola TaxID=616992 RepID=UPI0004A73A8E|nr:hypothetical protein [Polycyclovorans algicola]